MQCTLLVPHLWWPGEEAYRDLDLRDLAMLLGRSRRQTFPALGWEAWLCQAFEVERQHDWPIAPLTLTIDGADPEEAYWLRADPVHLRLHRDRLLLADSNAFSLTHDEATALVEALNGHFAPDGFRFTAPRADRWYLRLDRDPGIATSPLDDVAGRDIAPYLPTGGEALRWQRIANEIQMLLHAHPVNEAREERGEPVVNAVWLWGGGRRATVHGRHFGSVTSDDALAAALAANADIAAFALDPNGRDWLARVEPLAEPAAPHLIVLTELARCARRADSAGWRSALEFFARQWIAPLLAALKDGRIARFVLIAPGPAGCERFELNRAALYKFWRRVRPLSGYRRERASSS